MNYSTYEYFIFPSNAYGSFGIKSSHPYRIESSFLVPSLLDKDLSQCAFSESILGDFLDLIAKRLIQERERIKDRYVVSLGQIYLSKQLADKKVNYKQKKRKKIKHDLFTNDIEDKMGVRILNSLLFYAKSVSLQDKAAKLLMNIICLESLITSDISDSSSDALKEENMENEQDIHGESGVSKQFRMRIAALLCLAIKETFEFDISKWLEIRSDYYKTLKEEFRFLYSIRCDIAHRGDDIVDYCKDISSVCGLVIKNAIQFYCDRIRIDNKDPLTDDFYKEFIALLDNTSREIENKSGEK